MNRNDAKEIFARDILSEIHLMAHKAASEEQLEEQLYNLCKKWAKRITENNDGERKNCFKSD